MKTKVNYLDNIFTKLEGGGGSEMLCRNCFVINLTIAVSVNTDYLCSI